jgi:hypothetical protein
LTSTVPTPFTLAVLIVAVPDDFPELEPEEPAPEPPEWPHAAAITPSATIGIANL